MKLQHLRNHGQNRQRRHRIAMASTAFAVGIGGLLVSVGAAGAISAPIHITSTVNVRPGPSTTSGAPLGVIPTGGSPDFHCWLHGQNIGGVDVWFDVTYSGMNGYYASYWDDSTYSTDAQITPKYGIPQCGSSPSPAPVPTSAPQVAANWAAAQVGRNLDSGLCLQFVFQAWLAAGVNLRNQVSVPIGSNTYPVDVWGHFRSGTTGAGTPPAGALTFYASRTGARSLSHVVLSEGGGRLVSTTDGLNGSTVHYETTAQRSYSIELGWWLPSS